MKLTRLCGAAIKGTARLVFGVAADVATLGGAVNDGWFRNGHCTYTTRALRETARDLIGKPNKS